jgi:DNA-binding NtrC family response regulator
MKNIRILVVDDEPHLTGALCRALSLLGGGSYVAEGFGCAESALARLAEAPADLLVTDFRLPGMDGLELIGRVRELRPGMPSILITGYSTSEIEAAGLARAQAYLAKPFSLGLFVQVVQDVLGRARDPAP